MSDELIAEARALYTAGFNVFPIRWASKEPYGPHGIVTTARIHASFIPELFSDSNIGVMTGRLSQNLFILDCDDEATFETVGVELDKRQIAAWIRMGMRGGQYWLRCAEGEVGNVNLGKLQVLGNRLYTVAPPSAHPAGVLYDWQRREGDLPPLISIQALDFLKLSLAGKSDSKKKRDKTTLPPVAHQVLVEENTSNYKSNSEAEFAACLSMISAGIADFMIRTIFAQFNPPHYAKHRGRSFDKHTLAVAHKWLEEQQPLKSRGGQFDHSHSEQFIAFADSRPWPGRTGNTDKAVYLALCQRMRMERGNRVFRASVRELSEIANVGTQAVQAALKRLREGELVKYEKRDDVCGASFYSLAVTEDMPGITTVGETYTNCIDSVVSNVIENDAFHVKALGKSACMIWRLLLSERKAMTVAEIAKATGRVVSTITVNLTKLETAGMARPVDATRPARWVGIDVEAERLHQIAGQMGTEGKGTRRKAVHLEERQKHVSAILIGQKRRFLSRRMVR